MSNVQDGDIDHAAVVVTQLNFLSTTFHAHHEGEDSRLWPTLTTRAPDCSAHVERMKAQHEAMLAHMNALDLALPAWRATARGADAHPAQCALDGINRALTEHLGDEEQTIVPVMEVTMTPTEVKWFGEHGRKSTPKGQTWNMLGGILRGQPDGGDAWLRKNLPAPVRFLWRRVDEPKYLRYRTALEGEE